MSIGGKGKSGIEEASDNIFWTTMSDLMLGLAIIFMTLFILAMTGFSQEKIKVEQQRVEATKQLAEKLQNEKIDATVDNLTGSVKISEVELFEVGSYNLSPKGKQFLNKFVPIYLNVLLENPAVADNIENIIVQGHTDSQMFKGANSENEQFSKNMFLSLQRAYAVQEYMFKTSYNKKYDPILRKILVVEGKSYAEPVLNAEGKEDLKESRRVELRLRVKGQSIGSMFGLNFNGD